MLHIVKINELKLSKPMEKQATTLSETRTILISQREKSVNCRVEGTIDVPKPLISNSGCVYLLFVPSDLDKVK
jgi:hypothetical protein